MAEQTFADRYGPWAVVAGAGAGLGAAYARQLAERGLDLVLVDRDAETIDDLAHELPTTCRTLVLDLAADDAAGDLLDVVADLDVGLFVANAASSYVGRFRDQPFDDMDRQLRINLRTPLAVLVGLVPRLATRERSGIILMSSQSSRRGAPLVATYAGTKAYLAVLAESLWDELSGDGIDVLAVLPGSTRTPGWLSSLPQSGTGTAGVMDPDDVVREVLDTLGTGVPSLIAGAGNRDADAFLDSMPRADAVRVVGDVMRSMYPDDRDADPTV